MEITTQSFPHPVLGIQDDIEGTFNVNFTWSCDRAFYYLSPVFNLQNETIENFIKENSAVFVIHVECANTFYRNSFQINSTSPLIKIDAEKLRDKVEVGFYIITTKGIDNYTNSKVHPDYGDQKFFLDKGDVIAYGGNSSFLAVKNYESLKAVSSIMVINKDDKEKGLGRVNYSAPKIELFLSKENYQIYNECKNDPNFISIFHTSLVLPVLFKALSYIRADDDQLRTEKWFEVIKTRLNDEKLSVEDDDKHFEVIQKIFGNPLDRFFYSINQLKEYYEND